MLKIRLRREGSRNHPFFRMVVSDKRNVPTGTTLDVIGLYNPKTDQPLVQVDLPRYQAWIAKGAHPSDSVKSLVTAQQKRAAKGPAQ